MVSKRLACNVGIYSHIMVDSEKTMDGITDNGIMLHDFLSVADIFLVGNYHRCTEMGYRRLLSTKMGDCCQFNHICRICRLFGIGK